MEIHKVNKSLTKVANFIIPNYLFPTTEINRENIENGSYIFAPNHTSNFDGYLIWSLLANTFDIDTFMKKEFWDHFPLLSRCLSCFNVYPLSRDKVSHIELKDEIDRINEKDRSLIIFPQGRHVDPEVMVNMPQYNFNTLPMGAFYISAKSNKPLVPIFIEPIELFKKEVVLYGKPIKPSEFDVINAAGRINKENLDMFAKEWFNEIVRLYTLAKNFHDRELRSYKIEKKYWTSNGKLLINEDPNLIMKYLPMLEEFFSLHRSNSFNNLAIYLILNGINTSDALRINQLNENYENYFQKRRTHLD